MYFHDLFSSKSRVHWCILVRIHGIDFLATVLNRSKSLHLRPRILWRQHRLKAFATFCRCVSPCPTYPEDIQHPA